MNAFLLPSEPMPYIAQYIFSTTQMSPVPRDILCHNSCHPNKQTELLETSLEGIVSML